MTGYTYFPDFFHPNATDWWADQIAQFYAVGPEFDGLWVDMNEPSNFCNAQCGNNTMVFIDLLYLSIPFYFFALSNSLIFSFRSSLSSFIERRETSARIFGGYLLEVH